MYRDIVLQIRLNPNERKKLGKLAEAEMVSLAEKIRLMIRDASLPN
jgi:hypothetical protein